jgi:ribosome maturation factor RimP
MDVTAIADAVSPVVAALGLDLYDIEVTGSGRARIVRVMIDRPAGEDGGIDLEAIAAATEAVSPILDKPPVDKILSGSYSLEVSSPGLERPLRTPVHFARAVGETISVKAAANSEGADEAAKPVRARLRGVVVSAGDDSFILLGDDGTEHTISYAEVVQARTVFEWGPQPKGAKAGKSGKATGAKGSEQRAKGRNKEEAVRR